jgi:hypothetical protein
MSTAVRKDIAPATQRKLILTACYDRGFMDERARRPHADENELLAKGGEEALRRYRAGRRLARREREKGLA